MRIGRYAPSPTGGLHLGNLLAAVVVDAWLKRDASSSRFLLRMEDLDQARCRATFSVEIVNELSALAFEFDAGPTWDDVNTGLGPYVQSACAERYVEALLKLKNEGYLFACDCSRKDLAAVASAPHTGDEGPRYSGRCAEKELPFDDPTHPVAWRFRVPTKVIRVEDAFCGTYAQNVNDDVGAFVVRRKDGVIAYHLAVVVDDAHQGVTEVVRGRDLLSSTPRQIALQRALQLPTPDYAHGPLLVDEAGHRLAKRRGNETVTSWLTRVSPEELLGRIGQAFDVCAPKERISLAGLRSRLSLEHLAQEALVLPVIR